jgi:carboxymethylenebutenolidase
MSITTEDVSISVDGATMPAYLARPDGGEKLPAVVVWMEIFGVNSHIKDVTERVAKEGYVALAPNFFHRTAPDLDLGYTEEGRNEGFGHLGQLTADQMIADAKAAIAYLRDRDDVRSERIGVIGFCIGGHLTYLTACENDVAAAACFYGGGIAAPEGPGGAVSTISRTEKIGCPILCLFGAKDAHISLDQVEAVRSALADTGRQGDVVVYDEAEHGFFCDQRATYHADSAADAWTRVKRLFQTYLAQA